MGMGEPIKLYTKDGAELIICAPSEAERMVASGEATTDKPAPKPKTTTRRKATTSK